MNNTPKLLAAAVALVLLNSGCATKQPVPALDQANATYARVSEATLSNNYSTEDLNVAKTRLDYANKAWNSKKKKGVIEHRAYLAEQYALIAEQRSELLRHQESIENAELERTQVQMGLRASEANDARSAAQALAAKAEQLQQEVAAREDKLKQQLAELDELKALQAKSTDRGMVLTLGDVLFDTGEATLRAGAYQNIDRVAGFLHNYPQRSLLIEGHTDNVGDEGYNYELSIERANAVRVALLEQGIDRSRLQSKGLGENTPVASNHNAAGRQQNRRVELIFGDVAVSDEIISSIDE